MFPQTALVRQVSRFFVAFAGITGPQKSLAGVVQSAFLSEEKEIKGQLEHPRSGVKHDDEYNPLRIRGFATNVSGVKKSSQHP